jgi:hypothetical protein
MVSITRCWRSASLTLLLAPLLALWTAFALAGSIEPVRGQLTLGEEGYVLSAEFAIDLGTQLEEAVTRGVTLNFNLEFTLSRKRWYWVDEHIAGHVINYRLSYNALTRQYRLSVGGLHRAFASLEEALRVLGRIADLPIVDKVAIKPGETYYAALRLALDKSQLPKPFQVDAIASKDWQVDARVLRWQFVPSAEAK